MVAVLPVALVIMFLSDVFGVQSGLLYRGIVLLRIDWLGNEEHALLCEDHYDSLFSC